LKNIKYLMHFKVLPSPINLIICLKKSLPAKKAFTFS
jgi:hypothetical protein